MRLPRRGKGQALAVAERDAPPGRLLLCDADLRRRPRAARRERGRPARSRRSPSDRAAGFGIVKRTARELIRLGAGDEPREPLSGPACALARPRGARASRSRPGFGCEARMTIDALRGGLDGRGDRAPARHRATGRDLRGFAPPRPPAARRRCSPSGRSRVNHRGLRLPLVGWIVGAGRAPQSRAGCRDRARRRPLERPGARLRRRTSPRADDRRAEASSAFPAVRPARRHGAVSGALLVGLAANALNQLDTRPGRALKAYVARGDRRSGRRSRPPSCSLPYDLREMAMLGDAGSNALGALLGFEFRGEIRGTESVAGDRSARRAHSPR